MSQVSDLILINNHHFVAYNKPGGMAVQSMQNKEQSLEVILYHYTKSQLFLIHRIDQPCSGIVLFAKKKATAAYFSEALQHQKIARTYLAIVTGKPEKAAATLEHFLFAHKKSNKSFIVDSNHKEGKLSILDYKILGTIPGDFYLLEIALHTGRHHQIRAQLGAIGCPILGDIKYGSKNKRQDNSIALHAWKLKFDHPVDHKTISLLADLPSNDVWQDAKSFINT